MSGYPFIIQHNQSEKHHVVTGKDSHSGKQKTFCGWLRDELDCREVSKTIPDALMEKSLCKICMMSPDVVEIVVEEIKAKREFQPPT